MFSTFFFLLSASLLTGFSTALQRMGKSQAKKALSQSPFLFFLSHPLELFFKGKKWEGLLFSLLFTKPILQLCYALFAFSWFLSTPLLAEMSHEPYGLLAGGALIIIAALAADFLAGLIATWEPQSTLYLCAPLTSCFISILTPLSALVFKTLKFFISAPSTAATGFSIREKILEIAQDSELAAIMEPSDQQLLSSLASFKEKVAREVMVPRVDMFSLPAETSIKAAAQSFLKEGYSRIPVYKESIDQIIGVLLYKEVLRAFAQGTNLESPIERFVKPVFYTPETKKISHLLQEFRAKQLHLAIVVDEYGGTEGIVTIEDILEELVGEIADEYDIGEKTLFFSLPSGGWVVDAKMNILDIEEELGIQIPQSPEYDTIGGYIFHRAGAIPSKGWRIHLDDCDLEVLSSNERALDRVKITKTEPSS